MSKKMRTNKMTAWILTLVIITFALCATFAVNAADNMTVMAASELSYPKARDLNVEFSTTTNSVTVTWDELPTVGTDGVKYYMVYCYSEEEDYESATQVTYPTTNAVPFTHTFSGLEDGTTYNVGVAAEYQSEYTADYEDIVTTSVAVSFIDENGETQNCTDFTVVDSDTTNWSEGWYVVTGEVTVDNGITASGDIHLILTDGSKLTVIADEEKGIYTDGNLSIYAQSDENNMGELEVKSTSAGDCGIGAEKDLIISGGAIVAEGDRFGICAENLTISGGEIYSKSNDSKSYEERSIALYAENDIEITDGAIETTSGKQGYGIYSYEGSIAISGGSVKTTGDDCAMVAYGYSENDIYAENGNITISGGIVDATALAEGSIGIYAIGAVNIYCDEASRYPSTNSYFTGTINSDTNNGCAIYGAEGINVGNMLEISIPEGGTVKSFSDEVESFYAVAQSDEDIAADVTIKPVESKNPFTDVNASDWYYEDVIYAVENGLFNGTTETTFAPDDQLTRAMLVTVLYRAEGEPRVSGITSFSDLEKGLYYLDAVAWAQQNGIVKGVSETEFAPDQNITREQIAAIIYRWAIYKGMDAVTMEENLHFEDSNEISEYAVSAMNWAVVCGLMKGKTESTLNPQDYATRAETAAILHRFIEANN